MDPTLLKKHPTKSTTAASKMPPPDPILVASPSSTATTTTIKNISSHFAKLYANHRFLASLKASSHPHAHFHQEEEKGLRDDSSALDSSCVALTKSSSQHGRIHPGAAPADLASGNEESYRTKTKVKEKDNRKYSLVNVKKKKPLADAPPAQKALLDGHKSNLRIKKSSSGAREGAAQKKEEEFYDGRRGVKKAYGLMSKSLELEKPNQATPSCEMNRPCISLAVNGRRKSFCCSQAELADFFCCTGVKVVAVDMPPFMQIHAVDCARKARDSLEKFTSKTLAFTLKKEFDGVYGPAWHCIVGTSFGSFVTHSVGGFMYFSMDQKLYILLFKTTVQRAD
ncbi:uncharacterized protein LOC113767408 [Coffea eugenioides]|uniref:uncharacterized protein LOC113767408 n=1 Tax=Coffea eugenioides TaxID=49369 RepID=UPI000F60E66C|nr:uncharacterized protein LOC113767408 [Coffea eugenioides]